MDHDNKRPPPYFREFASDTLAKLPFRAATFAARGLLYTLRLELWVNERLPADPGRLARVLGVTVDEVEQLLPEILDFFEVTSDGFIVSTELEKLRAEFNEKRRRQAEGGRIGAVKANAARSTKRASNLGQGRDLAEEDASMADGNSAGDRAVDGTPRVKRPFSYPPAFDTFWSAYPRQVNKLDAFRAWQKAVNLAGSRAPEDADPKKIGVEAIQKAVEAFAQSRKGDDPTYIPHAATWLTKGGWDDPPQKPVRKHPPGYVPLGVGG